MCLKSLHVKDTVSPATMSAVDFERGLAGCENEVFFMEDRKLWGV